MIHRRDSKPANADPWEEEYWKCGSERAAAGAREGRESDEENLTLSVIRFETKGNEKITLTPFYPLFRAETKK